jgi:hypothetical protein
MNEHVKFIIMDIPFPYVIMENTSGYAAAEFLREPHFQNRKF